MLTKYLVLGTEVFSGNWGIKISKNLSEKIILEAHKKGINELDVASSYGKSNSVEKLIGKIIKKNNIKFSISSKFKIENKKTISGIVQNVEKQLDKSLKYLNVENLHTYYFHSGNNEEFFIDEVWKLLEDRKKLGDIKRLGLSIKHDLVLKNDLKQLFKAKDYNISVVQTVLNMFSNQSLKKLIPYCKKNKFEIYARMPLAKGLLSGSYNDNSSFLKNDPRLDSLLTKKIINYRLANKNLSLEKVIKWPLKNSKKVVFSVKNLKQLNQITKINYKR